MEAVRKAVPKKEGTQIFDRFSNFINKCFQKGGDLL